MDSKIGLRVDRLRERRGQMGLSQRELARRCGFSDALIRRYEIGASDPTGYSLKVLAGQLDVSADYLLGMTDDPRGHVGYNQIKDDERIVLDTYRRDGWPGVFRLGAERISK